MKRLFLLLTLLLASPALAQMPPPGPIVTNPTGKEYLSIVGGTPGTSIQLNTIATFVGGGGSGSLVIGTTSITGGTSGNLLYDNAGILGQLTTTGSGSVVLSTSPSLITPNLGTPSAATLTNATGLPISTGLSGLGTGAATALGVNVGSSGAFVVNGGALGIPSSGTLTNATGLPLAGLAGAGTGVISAMGNAVNGTGGLLTYGLIGTSGATIPLNNGTNTASGQWTFSNINVTGGAITGLPNPTNPSDAATKQYVDSSAAGLTPHTPVALATAGALAANTYNNGSFGVGATLTANANGNLVIDGTTNPTAGTRILVKDESTAANNGIYTVTVTGGASQEWLLTRATDANTPGTTDPTKIGFGTYVLVTGGSTNLNSSWAVNSTVTTIGTSAITWAQFTAGFSGVVSVGGMSGVIGIDSTLHFTGSNLGVAAVTNGSTLISSGTNGDILSNNGGVLGQVGTTGSGSVVLSTSATLTTPNLGTPSAVTLTNATGLPVSTGLSGLGTGVATALGNAVNTSGGFATYGSVVTGVTNSDGSLTISPTTGAVVGSLNLGHANTWTATQTFNTAISSQTVSWWSNDTPPVNAIKFGNRLFGGDAVNASNSSAGCGSTGLGDWLTAFFATTNYGSCAYWPVFQGVIESQQTSTGGYGTSGLLAAGHNANISNTGFNTIGLAAFAQSDYAGTLSGGAAYAGYFECDQLQNNNGQCVGVETDNHVATGITATQPDPFAQSNIVNQQLACGGGFTPNGGDCGAAMQIVPNVQAFHAGIVFDANSVTPTAPGGSVAAIEMPEGMQIMWFSGAATSTAAIAVANGSHNLLFTVNGGGTLQVDDSSHAYTGVTCSSVNASTMTVAYGIVTHC